MFSNKFALNLIISLAVIFTLASCSNKATTTAIVAKTTKANSQLIALDVYKSPNYACCKKKLSHLNENSFESRFFSNDYLSDIKNDRGIAPRSRSCHSVTSTDGYIFEADEPTKFIQQFMQAILRVDVMGLSDPAMPASLPGMEVDDKFQPVYRLHFKIPIEVERVYVSLLKPDSTHKVYAHVQSYKEQF